MSHFKNKYLKYKSKYLQLKYLHSTQYGGDLPIIKYVDSINLFTDPEMERYMNPIHGLILCYTGTIPNNYWLYKSKLINKKQSELLLNVDIIKICKNIPGNIQPTKKLRDLKPIDYGRFIAIKYINMKSKDGKNDLFNNPKYYNIDKCINNLLRKYIDTVNQETYFSVNNDNIYIFKIILFCLCWVTNNDEGIAEYYKGIREIFDLLRVIPKIKTTNLVLQRQENPNSFEKIVVKLTQQEFKIYYQENTQHFCFGKTELTYSDCGEISALNFINLLCFNEFNFDIIKLNKSSIQELFEFYRIFTNLNLISDVNFKPEIFGKHLNARDAWSYLIINYAYHNLRFSETCQSVTGEAYGYNLDGGLSLNDDAETGNFFQLIKNLLGITKWEDIINENVQSIQDNTIGGVGDIIIQHNKYGKFIIHCKLEHYEIEWKKKEIEEEEEYNLSSFTPSQ